MEATNITDPIPLLTPYKMGKFNLAHRYILHTISLSILFHFNVFFALAK